MIEKVVMQCPGCEKEMHGFLKDSTFVCPQCSATSQIQAAAEEWERLEEAKRKEFDKKLEQSAKVYENKERMQKKIEQAREHRQQVSEQQRDKAATKARKTTEENLREREKIRTPLHIRVANVRTDWLPFTQISLGINCFFSVIVGIIIMYHVFSTPMSSESFLAEIIIKVILCLFIAIGVFSVFGMYQMCKAVRTLVKALKTPTE